MESNNRIPDEIHLTTSTNRRERMSVLMALIICFWLHRCFADCDTHYIILTSTFL